MLSTKYQSTVFKQTDNKTEKLSLSAYYSIQRLTVKLVFRGNSTIDNTKVFKTTGSLMKVEIIAECSLEAFCNTFDLH